MSSTVSVIVPVGPRREFLNEQLVAIASQETKYRYEVIVVDNALAAGNIVVPDARFQVVQDAVIRTPGYARNAGARAACGELLLFCDADDIVTPSWIESLATALEIGDVAGGPVDDAALDPLPPGRRSARLPLPRDLDLMPWFIGSNLGLRSRAFHLLGGWEETYRAAEEVDLCWRAQLAGLVLADAPDALVHYRPRHDRRQAFKQGLTWGFAAPRLRRRYRKEWPISAQVPRAIASWQVLASTIVVARDRGRTGCDWWRLFGLRLGRLAGSLRWRCIFP